jgi:hypothetical protein
MVTDRIPLPRAPRPRGALPLADLAGLASAVRRTTVVRLLLGLALAVTSGLAVWSAAGLGTHTLSFLPRGSSTMVVLDQSRSVYLAGYRRVDALLRRLVDADAAVGLVIFSDGAYELLPPGVHGRELRPLLRFYSRDPRAAGAVDPVSGAAINPWTDTISGGTRISSGLQLARQALERDHVRRGVILLVSDLETAAEDRPEMVQELQRIEAAPGIDLRIVPLFPVPTDEDFFDRIVGHDAFVDPARLAPGTRAATRERIAGSSPEAFVVAAGVLLLLLALNELACGRLELARPSDT